MLDRLASLSNLSWKMTGLANDTFVHAHFVDKGIMFAPQKDVTHRFSANVESCNNLSAIFHFTGLAQQLDQPGAKSVAMDNACLA